MNTLRNSLSWLAQYNKAIVPVAVLGLLKVLSNFGVLGDMTVKEALTLVVTAGFVWLVPNKG